MTKNSELLLTIGQNNYVKLYNVSESRREYLKNNNPTSKEQYITKGSVSSIDLSYENDKFVTGGEKVEIWDMNKFVPIAQFNWGFDTLLKTKFNPVETNIILCTALDRSVYLYDIRMGSKLSRITLINKSSCLCWNPMEPFNFVLGNEDSNAYTFDMRKMQGAKMIHKDHIGAILDIDFSPTGGEFVTGSFDKTIRIFPFNKGKSKEIYHGKRMQKVFAVLWSLDNSYIFSGSEDTNIGVWKAISHKKVGSMTEREKNAFNYREKLIKRFR